MRPVPFKKTQQLQQQRNLTRGNGKATSPPARASTLGLRAIGTPENQVDALFASALAYVKMWEKAEKAASKLSPR